jgi:hypothetical protein
MIGEEAGRGGGEACRHVTLGPAAVKSAFYCAFLSSRCDKASLLHLFARGNDGRTAGRGRCLGAWLPAAAAAARCMHAGLLGGLGSVRPPLSLSRRYLLASGLWREKKKATVML